MNPQTSRFLDTQNGIVLLGQSAIDSSNDQQSLLRNIAALNERMQSSTILRETVNVSGGSPVKVQTAVDKTIMGIFDSATASRYGFDTTGSGGVNFAMEDLRTKATVRGLLRSEGISVSDSTIDNAASFVVLPSHTFEHGLTARKHVNPFHEIGHTVTHLSGTKAPFDFLSDEGTRLINQYGSLEKAPLMEKLRVFHTGMALHGAEEAFAEGFGITAASKMQAATYDIGYVTVGQRILNEYRGGTSTVSYLGGDDFGVGYGANAFRTLFPELDTNFKNPAENLFFQTGNQIAEENFVQSLLSKTNPLNNSPEAFEAVASNISIQNQSQIRERSRNRTSIFWKSIKGGAR